MSAVTGPRSSADEPLPVAMFIFVCSTLAVLEVWTFCAGRPKQRESVTTAKASAVLFIVVLFSFGNGSAEHAYSLSFERDIQETRSKGRAVICRLGRVACPRSSASGAT